MESHLPVRNPGDLRTTRLDVVSSTVTYVGKASPGASTAAAIAEAVIAASQTTPIRSTGLTLSQFLALK